MRLICIRLVCIDVDGTLVPGGAQRAPDQNVRAVRRARELGAKVVLATGRPYWMVAELIAQLGGVDAVVALNGAERYPWTPHSRSR